jgi:hypothetical protein
MHDPGKLMACAHSPTASYAHRRRLDSRRRERGITPIETIAVLTVIAAVVGMTIWFLFFSSGGIGPGTV